MPLYVFCCENPKCKTKQFEVLCSFVERDKIVCENCGKPSKASITTPSISFKNPTNTSRWDSFTYRAGYNLENAQDLRRKAEKASHMGSNPYLDQEKKDIGAIDIDKCDGKIL